MPDWTRGAVGYQVYVRSFADGDGDGVGDLVGARQRLPWIAALGVDVVWLTPFYASPGHDHGYDVSDHRAVDPQFGTTADLEALVADAHELGLRVLVDLVPNHVSIEHPWFVGALAGDEELRDRFVVVPGRVEDGPPNNWLSYFGGPAWTHRDELGGWYMHLFLPEQPDLDWGNEAVVEDLEETMRFWLARGVDGFRIDVTQSLTEDPELRDNPWRVPPRSDMTAAERFAAMEHRHDLDQDSAKAIFARWRRLCDAHDAWLVGETYLLDPAVVARYVTDERLHTSFWFPTLHTGWDRDELGAALAAGVAHGGDRFAWPMSSHDDPHAATRFGGGEVGTTRMLAFAALVLGLPGNPFIYQGDELGLEDGVNEGVAADPFAARNDGVAGRDGSRTPMPWGDGPHLGFSEAEPWLGMGSNRRPAQTAAAQEASPDAPLHVVRRLVALRTERGDDLRGDAPVVWVEGPGPVLAYRRGDTLVAACVGEGPAALPVPAGARLLATSSAGPAVDSGMLHLPTDTAAVVALEG